MISLAFNIKRSGASVEPCRTPHVIFLKSEVQLLNATYCFLLGSSQTIQVLYREIHNVLIYTEVYCDQL